MEIRNRLVALYDVCNPTLISFLEFMNKTNNGIVYEDFRDLLMGEWLMNAKCCTKCNHAPIKDVNYTNNFCSSCGKFSFDCLKETLTNSIIVLVKFSDLLLGENFNDAFVTFSQNVDNAFEEFPSLSSWKQIWTCIDKAATTLDDFLNKKEMNYGESFENNKTWRRNVLILDLDPFMYVFKHLFKGKYSYVKINNFKPKLYSVIKFN